MKRFAPLLALLAFIAAPVQARPFHHGGRPHHPAPTVVYKSHHDHSAAPLIALASGLVGFAVGTAAAAPAVYTTTTYGSVPVNPQQCYTVVSRSTGNVTRRCVSGGDNQILYVD